jgi:hypothetical protein
VDALTETIRLRFDWSPFRPTVVETGFGMGPAGLGPLADLGWTLGSADEMHFEPVVGAAWGAFNQPVFGSSPAYGAFAGIRLVALADQFSGSAGLTLGIYGQAGVQGAALTASLEGEARLRFDGPFGIFARGEALYILNAGKGGYALSAGVFWQNEY